MRNSSKRSPKTGRHASIRKKNRRVPSLRLHKASGQAYVVLNGKAVYCGKHGTSEAEQQYHKAIAEWLAAGRQLPAGPEITVKELWRGSNPARKREILEEVSLNRMLSDTTLCLEKRKPFDVLAERPSIQLNRGDWI